jgi:hypothetical protein
MSWTHHCDLISRQGYPTCQRKEGEKQDIVDETGAKKIWSISGLNIPDGFRLGISLTTYACVYYFFISFKNYVLNASSQNIRL